MGFLGMGSSVSRHACGTTRIFCAITEIGPSLVYKGLNPVRIYNCWFPVIPVWTLHLMAFAISGNPGRCCEYPRSTPPATWNGRCYSSSAEPKREEYEGFDAPMSSTSKPFKRYPDLLDIRWRAVQVKASKATDASRPSWSCSLLQRTTLWMVALGSGNCLTNVGKLKLR